MQYNNSTSTDNVYEQFMNLVLTLLEVQKYHSIEELVYYYKIDYSQILT